MYWVRADDGFCDDADRRARAKVQSLRATTAGRGLAAAAILVEARATAIAERVEKLGSRARASFITLRMT